jgi:hypothetical protein
LRAGESEDAMSGAKMLRLSLFLSLGSVILVTGLSCGSQKTAENSENILNTYEADVPVVCSNSLTTELFEITYEIKATSSEPVLEGIPVELTFTGTAYFPTDLLNLALLIPGLDGIRLEDISATFVVRSGATGDPVVVGSSVDTPADIPIPLVNDYGTCVEAGINSVPCVIEPMEFDLSQKKGTFTPGATGTNILIGLDDSRIPLPEWDEINATGLPGPNGMRVKVIVGGEPVDGSDIGLECSMGRMNGDDLAEPLSDGELMEVPIE